MQTNTRDNFDHSRHDYHVFMYFRQNFSQVRLIDSSLKIMLKYHCLRLFEN